MEPDSSAEFNNEKFSDLNAQVLQSNFDEEDSSGTIEPDSASKFNNEKFFDLNAEVLQSNIDEEVEFNNENFSDRILNVQVLDSIFDEVVVHWRIKRICPDMCYHEDLKRRRRIICHVTEVNVL